MRTCTRAGLTDDEMKNEEKGAINEIITIMVRFLKSTKGAASQQVCPRCALRPADVPQISSQTCLTLFSTTFHNTLTKTKVRFPCTEPGKHFLHSFLHLFAPARHCSTIVA